MPESKERIPMEYRKLGSAGLDVSKICLGCMSFGDPQRGGHPWSLSGRRPTDHSPGARRGHQLL
jgi:aryl-alcohol dehydrogenase-like predicted oxidoreductase